jgi:polysaccharide biosynthesis/export protein
MQSRTVWPLLLAAALFVSGSLARRAQAQLPTTRPTPEQAQELLRTRPELVQQLQQRLQASGLTAEQVRARLRAEGYPESLLDAYLPGGRLRTAADTASAGTLVDAIEALGISDSTDVELMREVAGLRTFGNDTIPGDSLREPLRDTLRDTVRGARRDTSRLRARRDSALADSGFTIFGLDLFRNRTGLFDPNTAGPVDANYRLGPGDRLVLILTGDVELAHQLEVTREGFIVIPQVGQLYVANLTLAQLEDLLFTRLGRVYSGVRRGAGATTRFSLSVARLRSNQVYVVGDVARPSSYRVSSAGTALTAVYAAGGPTTTGSLRRVEIRRGGRTVSTLDVYDYLLRGDASRDVRLETGDVVFVPPNQGRVRVAGSVLRPATYEMLPGESLADVIRAAGGLRPTASQRRIQIERVLPPAQRNGVGRDRVVLEVSPGDPTGPGPRVPIEPGDVVRVFDVPTRVANRIRVLGNVWTPGTQGLTPGARLSDALRAAGGLKPDSYLGQVLVSRLRPDSTREMLRAGLRDTTGAAINDIPLREDDEIRVFSVSEFRPDRYVAIGGAVRKGGRFAFREGMTLRDLVLLGGGLHESALLNEAEIARLPVDRRNGVTAQAFRVPLDSSFLFERGPDGRYFGPPGIPASRGPTPDVRLQPYDNVLILRQPDFALQRLVVLGGEVRYPGRYALRNKVERLTDLIARAGGLTSEAYPEGIEFFRNRQRLGRVGVDLPSALRNARHRDNLILVDGDSVIIPPFSAVVTITGAVNAPVAVTYSPGRDLDYYIRAAGGPTQKGDATRAYVTQPNGKLESKEKRRFLPDGVPVPRPGSKVVVPEREPTNGGNLPQLIALFAQVAGTLAAVVAAIAAARR